MVEPGSELEGRGNCARLCVQHEVSVTLALTPLTIEVAVSALPTAAGSTGRNTSVAHFVAPHWGRIADRLAPLIDREDGEPGTSPAALICVPDSGAAVELADALRTVRPGIARILPVTDALRAARVLKTYGAPIVIVTPSDAERMLSASALPLDGVQVIALVGAEEYDADQLATVMTSVPKEARRVLVASEATPVVEVLLERYFHKAHRLADDTSSETTPAAVQYLCVRSSGAATLVPSLLDDLDPPSAVVVTADAASVQSALAAHGYPADAIHRARERRRRAAECGARRLRRPSDAGRVRGGHVVAAGPRRRAHRAPPARRAPASRRRRQCHAIHDAPRHERRTRPGRAAARRTPRGPHRVVSGTRDRLARTAAHRIRRRRARRRGAAPARGRPRRDADHRRTQPPRRPPFPIAPHAPRRAVRAPRRSLRAPGASARRLSAARSARGRQAPFRGSHRAPRSRGPSTPSHGRGG